MSVITFSGVQHTEQNINRIRYNPKHIIEHIVSDKIFGFQNYD
jgi:hypothetical protein